MNRYNEESNDKLECSKNQKEIVMTATNNIIDLIIFISIIVLLLLYDFIRYY